MIVDTAIHRLRAGGTAEWSEAAAHPHLPALDVSFRAERANQAEHTLALRQTGVKRTWMVTLNGADVGQLYPDENPHTIHLALPGGSIREGENRLRISPKDTLPDDIEVSIADGSTDGGHHAIGIENANGERGVRYAYGTSEIQEIKILGDWAYMWASLTVVVTPPGGGRPITRKGHTLSVLQKQNGRWVLVRDANMLATVTEGGE